MFYYCLSRSAVTTTWFYLVTPCQALGLAELLHSISKSSKVNIACMGKQQMEVTVLSSVKCVALWRKNMQPNTDIASLFVHRSWWCYMECGGKLKYCIIIKLSSQIFMGFKWVWLYIGLRTYLQLCKQSTVLILTNLQLFTQSIVLTVTYLQLFTQSTLLILTYLQLCTQSTVLILTYLQLFTQSIVLLLTLSVFLSVTADFSQIRLSISSDNFYVF